jgi:hypothetical protein
MGISPCYTVRVLNKTPHPMNYRSNIENLNRQANEISILDKACSAGKVRALAGKPMVLPSKIAGVIRVAKSEVTDRVIAEYSRGYNENL